MPSITYVKGTIRKDAVAIIPKECRVTEARVLESIYGAGWVPAQLRAVEVGELPTAVAELERIVGVYGHEAVEKAYGHEFNARQAIGEILAMSPAKVKASGLLVENDAVPVEVLDDAVPASGKAAGKAAKQGAKAAASADSGGESAQAAV